MIFFFFFIFVAESNLMKIYIFRSEHDINYLLLTCEQDSLRYREAIPQRWQDIRVSIYHLLAL